MIANKLIDKIDGTGSTYELKQISELKGRDDFDQIMAYLFDNSTRAGTRVSALYYLTPLARESKVARELAIKALNDRSSSVRYRAYSLLAYSLDSSCLVALNEALTRTSHEIDAGHITAAIDAIKNRNHHFFMDRTHTGKTKWNVGVAKY